MTYGAYGGSDAGYNAQLCAIGEMWGHAIGYTQAVEKFGVSIGNLEDVDGWIYPKIFWDMFSANILTKKQIYDCLTSEVDTYDELVCQMYTLYPDKSIDIENVLKKYTFENNCVICSNQNISSSITVSGDKIFVENIAVNNGAVLRLDAGSSITINKPFVVESGSSLIMTKGN